MTHSSRFWQLSQIFRANHQNAYKKYYPYELLKMKHGQNNYFLWVIFAVMVVLIIWLIVRRAGV
jgi:hypothetical protein